MNHGPSPGFNAISAWLDTEREDRADDCAMLFCNDQTRTGKRYCEKHERCFYRNGVAFNQQERKAIDYYRDRQWRKTPPPPDDWEETHQQNRWGT